MRCDCCGKGWEIMYRTMDTRVYCLDCSRRMSVCCFGKAVIPTQWFRVHMSQTALASLEARGYKRVFKVTKPKWDFKGRHHDRATSRHDHHLVGNTQGHRANH